MNRTLSLLVVALAVMLSGACASAPVANKPLMPTVAAAGVTRVVSSTPPPQAPVDESDVVSKGAPAEQMRGNIPAEALPTDSKVASAIIPEAAPTGQSLPDVLPPHEEEEASTTPTDRQAQINSLLAQIAAQQGAGNNRRQQAKDEEVAHELAEKDAALVAASEALQTAEARVTELARHLAETQAAIAALKAEHNKEILLHQQRVEVLTAYAKRERARLRARGYLLLALGVVLALVLFFVGRHRGHKLREALEEENTRLRNEARPKEGHTPWRSDRRSGSSG